MFFINTWYRHQLTWLYRFLSSKSRIISNSTAEISLIGLLFFIASSISLLNTIERAFNDIYRVKKRRSSLSKIKSFWAILSFGPLLLILSFSLSSTLKTYWLVESLQHSVYYGWFMAHLPPFLLVWLAFLFLFSVMPNTHVPFTSAAFGALLGAIFWTFAKGLFGWYFQVIVPQNKFYGGLGTVPFFLLWLYVSWVIVLYGLELSFSHQYLKALKGGQLLADFKSPHYVQSLFLAVFLCIAEDFRNNKNSSKPGAISRSLEVPETEVHHVLEKLKKSKLIHTVEGTEDFFKPSRPLDRILLKEILGTAAFDKDTSHLLEGRPSLAKIRDMLQQIDNAVLESIENVTIDRLMTKTDGSGDTGENTD